ncbi:MAG: hypothetical protein ACPGUD_07115 [Parashewanella sp.]
MGSVKGFPLVAISDCSPLKSNPTPRRVRLGYFEFNIRQRARVDAEPKTKLSDAAPQKHSPSLEASRVREFFAKCKQIICCCVASEKEDDQSTSPQPSAMTTSYFPNVFCARSVSPIETELFPPDYNSVCHLGSHYSRRLPLYGESPDASLASVTEKHLHGDKPAASKVRNFPGQLTDSGYYVFTPSLGVVKAAGAKNQGVQEAMGKLYHYFNLLPVNGSEVKTIKYHCRSFDDFKSSQEYPSCNVYFTVYFSENDWSIESVLVGSDLQFTQCELFTFCVKQAIDIATMNGMDITRPKKIVLVGMPLDNSARPLTKCSVLKDEQGAEKFFFTQTNTGQFVTKISQEMKVELGDVEWSLPLENHMQIKIKLHGKPQIG